MVITLSFLYNKIPWFGKYSGYEYLATLYKKERIYLYDASENTFFKKIVGKLIQFRIKDFTQTTFGLATGFIFLKTQQKNIKHILYLENHLYLLKYASNQQLNNLIGTIHLPISQWSEERLSDLKRLRNAIILYQEEEKLFQKYLPNAALHFIRHGVNNHFFCPKHASVMPNKILCVGHYLRDFNILEQVFNKVKTTHKEVSLHLIIPKAFRDNKYLKKIAQQDNVYFYEGLTDEELLHFYQSSTLLLMPMQDSGANTAFVQAIACGLPIVTNHVGGIKSYGGESVFPIFENNDVAGMSNEVIKILEQEDYQLKLSNELRNFSLNYLDWSIIEAQHLAVYQQINQA